MVVNSDKEIQPVATTRFGRKGDEEELETNQDSGTYSVHAVSALSTQEEIENMESGAPCGAGDDKKRLHFNA